MCSADDLGKESIGKYEPIMAYKPFTSYSLGHTHYTPINVSAYGGM